MLLTAGKGTRESNKVFTHRFDQQEVVAEGAGLGAIVSIVHVVVPHDQEKTKYALIVVTAHIYSANCTISG